MKRSNRWVWLIASLATAIVFLLGDTFVIPNIMRPLFKHHLGGQMLDDLRLLPAALFYLIHIGGLIYLAVAPSLATESNRIAVINGTVLGLVSYSCYEMTSWTIMADWHVNLVLVDTAWGAFISGVSAWCGATGGRWWLNRSRQNPA